VDQLPPFEDYRIGVVGSLNRLWFDNKLIVDDFVLHDPKPTTTTLQWEKGHRYSLKLEYGQGGTGIKLVWLGGGQPGTAAPGLDASFSVQGKKKLPE
jgi:hypothetical protein